MKHVFLLGDPVGHSLSPIMQNAAFRANGLDWQYELCETPRAQLGETMARLHKAECVGANITVPHKQAAFEFVDELTDHARKVGAINTIVNQGGKLLGENTDVYGFTQALHESSVELNGARAVILGAGGAARSAAFALAEQNASRITIVNRTEERARKLANDLVAHYPKLLTEVNSIASLATAHLIVNATSVGMWPHESESPMQRLFPRGAAAIDLVYRPLQTRFLRDAERAGARPISGIVMLVHQGAAAFRLWTGRDAPVELMMDEAVNALRRM
jgi:shikimate dehydrogenase